MTKHRGKNDDWSKNTADHLGLAWCREDVERHTSTAPWHPLRRLYLRLCHDPSICFIPPGFITIIFCFLVIHGAVSGDLSFYQFLGYVLISGVTAMAIGCILDVFFLGLLPAIFLLVEAVFALGDHLLFHPLIWLRQRKDNADEK